MPTNVGGSHIGHTDQTDSSLDPSQVSTHMHDYSYTSQRQEEATSVESNARDLNSLVDFICQAPIKPQIMKDSNEKRIKKDELWKAITRPFRQYF